MVRKYKLAAIIVLVTTLCLTAVPEGAVAGKPGDSGFLSLRLGAGAREAAMGAAGVASSEGAAAIYWNPANLAFTDVRTDLLLQHQSWLGLFDQETAALAHRTSFGILGIYFAGFYSDTIERRGEEQVGVPEGTFDPYDVALGVSFAREMAEHFAAGVMVKFLYQKIDIYSDSGLAFDLFISHEATAIEGLRFGASVTNLGSQMNLNEEPFDLPRAIRGGVAYTPAQSFFAGKVTMAADVVSPNDGNAKAHVGAEYRMLPELALRAGSKVNYDSQGLTAGAGFRKGVIEVGYAFEAMSNDLDDVHKFALQLHY